MIKTLYLQNFQSHKETYLEFHPGVNVIVGETDAGKSAILRALYWLVFGKPSGDSFVRRNTKGAFVEVDIDNTSVGRLRGKTVNTYFLGKEEYKGFGQSVPPPISKALNLSEINFMRQMDPPFLFSKSAGEVAEYLNKLINLDIIGTSLTNINRMVKSAEKEQHYHESRILESRKQLKNYAWLDEAEEEVNKIEKQERIIGKLKNSIVQLVTELEDYVKYQHRLEQYIDTKDVEKRINQIDTLIKNIHDKQSQLTALNKTISSYKQAQKSIDNLPIVSGAEQAILAIEKHIGVYNVKHDKYTQLNNFINQYQHHCKDLAKYNSQEKAAMLQLQQEMPELCPLCGQQIKETKSD